MAINPRRKTQSAFNLQHREIREFIESEESSEYIYAHQREALLAVKNQLDDVEQPNIALVVLPTGCGKTGVAVLAPYVLDSRRVLILTPSNTISEQIFEAFGGGRDDEDMFLVQRGIVEKSCVDDVRPSAVLITKTSQIRQSLHNDLLIITAHQVGVKSEVKIEDIPPEGYDLVIVDEAHHYPASTWRMIIDYFPNTKRLFLTATPYHSKLGYILKEVKCSLAGLEEEHGYRDSYMQIKECYTLTLKDAITRGISRDKRFDEVGTSMEENEIAAMEEVAVRIKECLDEHDELDPTVKHQAMVLTQTVEKGGINPAEDFCECYNSIVPWSYHCEMYVGGSKQDILRSYQKGNIRTLVVVNKLKEGYNNKRVSVVAIVRNVAKESRVLFAQFVGRAMRKAHPDDPVTAVVIAHKRHKQRENYEQFDKVPDDDDDVVITHVRRPSNVIKSDIIAID